MNIHWPHNAQTVLDLSEDESYLYIKLNLPQYSKLSEQIERQLCSIDEWNEEGFFCKRKRLKRKMLTRLNKAMAALDEVVWSLKGEKSTIENKIVNSFLSRPIAKRKVNLMTVHNDVDISINDNPEYSERVYNPCRSDWMQAREGVKK